MIWCKKIVFAYNFLNNALIDKNASTEVLYFYKDSESMFSFLIGTCYDIDNFGGGGWWVVAINLRLPSPRQRNSFTGN